MNSFVLYTPIYPYMHTFHEVSSLIVIIVEDVHTNAQVIKLNCKCYFSKFGMQLAYI